MESVKGIRKPEWQIRLRKSWPVLLILLPGIVYFIMFKYVPMWGLLLSFKNFKPIYGFVDSAWVGFDNYISFFTSSDFPRLLVNTLWLAVYNILFYFPLPIILALLLHEVTHKHFKKTLQTLIYIPHFISWVVVYGICQQVLGADGLINRLVLDAGGVGIPFLYSEQCFRGVVLFQTIWKETGWGTIIFIAALTSIDHALYEAATIDGANRFHKLIYVTLPGIQSTITVMLLLRIGRFLDTGYEQIYLMLNAMNRQVGEVFDTYAYEIGILQGRFSYAIAASVFKSIIGLILVLSADRLAKKMGEEGIL
ncbi:MAG: ABC transporter permease [Acetanaerobacterium sp.]